MSKTNDSGFRSSTPGTTGAATRNQASSTTGDTGQDRSEGAVHPSESTTSVPDPHRGQALELLQYSHQEVHRLVAALKAEHDELVASMLAHHQSELDRLQTEQDGPETLRDGQAAIIPALPTRGLESAGRVVADAPGAGSGLEAVERDGCDLRSELDAANAEIEATRADALRLQGERDDALGEADDARFRTFSEADVARDDAIRIQAELDEALRMIDDGRDLASQEQWRLIEELDVVHQELATLRRDLAACRRELDEARQRAG